MCSQTGEFGDQGPESGGETISKNVKLLLGNTIKHAHSGARCVGKHNCNL